MEHEGPRIVAITGSDGQVGRALQRALQGTAFRTVALTRSPRDLSADRVVIGPLEVEEAQAALREADFVVHLAGTLRPLGGNSYQTANLDTTRSVARAVERGRAERVLFLSYVGADESERNAYLRTKAQAERTLTASTREAVIFRCTHIVGPPGAPGPTALAMIAKPGRRPSVLGDGQQAIMPLYLGDVVNALVAALDNGTPGVYELAGPDKITIDDLARVVNRDENARITHIPAWTARLLGLIAPSLPAALVDVMLRESIGDSSRAVEEFALNLTSIESVWRSVEPS